MHCQSGAIFWKMPRPQINNLPFVIKGKRQETGKDGEKEREKDETEIVNYKKWQQKQEMWIELWIKSRFFGEWVTITDVKYVAFLVLLPTVLPSYHL